MKKNKIALILSIATIAVLFFSAFKRDNHNFELSKQLSIFNNLVKEIDLFYVDTIAPENIIKTGIDAMLAKLDPYTAYYTEEGSEELKMMITGKYAGIGSLIRFHDKKNTTVIAEPYDNMPAAKAGLQIGDLIQSINGIKVIGMSSDSVSNMLRGEAGTKLTIEVERPGTKEPITIKVERENITLPVIPYYGILKDSVGYLQLESFPEGCAKEMRRALIDMKNKGASSYIIDLRSNGGGSLAEAIDIVNLFVPKGLSIVETKGKIKRSNETYKTTREPIDTVSPLIVLVDGQTASAAEIVSGSLQDLDRAVIIGSRTYGKGLVQVTRELPYNGYLKVTTSKYYIPSGRCIQAIDYSHRSANGEVSRTPDSLTNIFHTAAGREVRDGGGISPDIKTKGEKLTTLLYHLVQDMAIFDYATDYKLEHPSIASAETFNLSDEDYETFKSYLKSTGFSYDKESYKTLKQLKKMLELEGYTEATKEEVKKMESILQHNLDHDLDFFAKDVKRLIADEIIKRYYSQQGSIVYALRDDADIAESLKLFKDSKKYKEILQPIKK
ncbi:MAG: PDZ domain-containing protein [Bacteroidaceae bacterium]|nr:PDZ domain-containing protein [Bacteroidaceae bacterium]